MIRSFFVSILCICSLFVCESFAQVNLSVSLVAPDTTELSLYIYPLGINTDSDDKMAKDSKGFYNQTIKTSSTGMYNMVCVSGSAQYSMPLFLKNSGKHELKIDMNGICPKLTILTELQSGASQSSNDALYEFNALYYQQSKEVWTNAEKMSDDDLRNMLTKYEKMSQAIVSNEEVDANVREYVKVWAYLEEVEAVNVFRRANDATRQIDYKLMIKDPAEILDSPMSLLHQSALSTAAQGLPKGTLLERLQFISEKYTNNEVRRGIQKIVLNGFIRNYNYASGAQSGLDMLVTAKEKYGIEDNYITSFKERISATPGADFPDVVLKDVAGKDVSISQFKGKYVYIDLWASWCVPCCKEVPHLQSLEKELTNEDVVFVSISTDSSESPWRKKMEQLNMHGNQWINADGKLCDKLNVSGIPHFLIYDKNGKLLIYDAPRPSSGDKLKNLLQGLK